MSEKISAMTAAATVQPTDQVPFVRGGQNLRAPASAFGTADKTEVFELIGNGARASIDSLGTTPVDFSAWVISRIAGTGAVVDASSNTLLFKENGIYELSFSTTLNSYGSYGTSTSFSAALFAKMLVNGPGVSETVPGVSEYSVLSIAVNASAVSPRSLNMKQTLLVSITGATPDTPCVGATSVRLLPTAAYSNTSALDARAFVTVRKLPTLI